MSSSGTPTPHGTAQVGPLGQGRPDEQAAVGAAVDGESIAAGETLGDEPVGGGVEVVEDVLLVGPIAGVVPRLAVLDAAAQAGDGEQAARRAPRRDLRRQRRRLGDGEAAVAVEDRRRGRRRRDVGPVDEEQPDRRCRRATGTRVWRDAQGAGERRRSSATSPPRLGRRIWRHPPGGGRAGEGVEHDERVRPAYGRSPARRRPRRRRGRRPPAASVPSASRRPDRVDGAARLVTMYRPSPPTPNDAEHVVALGHERVPRRRSGGEGVGSRATRTTRPVGASSVGDTDERRPVGVEASVRSATSTPAIAVTQASVDPVEHVDVDPAPPDRSRRRAASDRRATGRPAGHACGSGCSAHTTGSSAHGVPRRWWCTVRWYSSPSGYRV